VSTAAAGYVAASHLYAKRKYSKARQIWDSQPENVVVLHQVRAQNPAALNGDQC
jgi:hypothetical protein